MSKSHYDLQKQNIMTLSHHSQ